ncbi:MAG: biotin/lipoyl-containing protein, partial [Phycisphaerae bacterium]
MSRDFMLPDLGEGIAEAQVVQVLIAEGDQVAEDQAIIEVETDKAAVEIPSPYAGVAEKIHVEAGQTINVGDVMVSFSGNGDAKVAEAKVKKPAPAAAKPASAPAAPAQRGTGKTVPAAPAVRKLAREMGVDLAAVAGSGPGGRVLKADVEKAATGGGGSAAPVPPRPASLPGKAEMDKWGPTRRVGLSQIRKTIAKQMARSVYTIPHVTHTDDADITELERL